MIYETDEYTTAADIAYMEMCEQEDRMRPQYIATWRQDLAKLMACGAKDLATAIRWDMESFMSQDDIEFYGIGMYIWERSLPYSWEHDGKTLEEHARGD